MVEGAERVRFPEGIIDIEPCPNCGGERLAAQIGVEATSDKPAETTWYRWCPACVDLDAVKSDGRPRKRIWWCLAMDKHGEVRWWMRRGMTLSAKDACWPLLTAARFEDLLTLRRHRLLVGKGEWKLELRADGRVWVPYCRGDQFRSSAALPLRQGTFRKDTNCYACRRFIVAGTTVWRAELEPGRSYGGWGSSEHRKLAVCQVCHHAAALADVPDLVRHGKPKFGFVVFDGDAGADGISTAEMEVVRG